MGGVRFPGGVLRGDAELVDPMGPWERETLF